MVLAVGWTANASRSSAGRARRVPAARSARRPPRSAARSPWARRTSSSRSIRELGAARGPRRRPGASTCTSTARPGTAGPYDPYEHRFGMISVPVGVPAAARRRATRSASEGRRPDVRDRLLRRRRDVARATSTRPCNFAARVGRARSCSSARTTAGRSRVPLAEQTAGPIHRRAEGYGFPGVRVDGNDVLAVYRGHAGGGRAGPARRRSRR